MSKNKQRLFRTVIMALVMILLLGSLGLMCSAEESSGTPGDVAGAVENTWDAAKGQIKAIVDKVVFPVIDAVLAIFFFIKIGTAYFDYRKNGQFEWTGPAILFGCLVFTLTAPLYIWKVLGM